MSTPVHLPLPEWEILPTAAQFDTALTAAGATSLWGVAPCAPLHLGYDSLIVPQKLLIEAGFRHTVMIADYHAMLTYGFSMAEVTRRAIYYENYLRHCCKMSANFVLGSSFQAGPAYVEALYSAMSKLPIKAVKDTLPRQDQGIGSNPVQLASYLYALMQCLDACHLDAQVVFGESAQKKVYELLSAFDGGKPPSGARFSKEKHNNNWAERAPTAFIYAPTGVDIKGNPLNKSSAKTRISIHETPESLRKKIGELFAPPAGQLMPADKKNVLLELFRFSVFPWISTSIEIKDSTGSCRSYQTFEELKADYDSGSLHPNDCKHALFIALEDRLSRIQRAMGESICDWLDVGKLIAS
jgi:tyrosyl-tRNA synthetase